MNSKCLKCELVWAVKSRSALLHMTMCQSDLTPSWKKYSPGASVVPASKLPIMTVEAPRLTAFITWPTDWMPPSAITGTPKRRAYSATYEKKRNRRICRTWTSKTWQNISRQFIAYPLFTTIFSASQFLGNNKHIKDEQGTAMNRHSNISMFHTKRSRQMPQNQIFSGFYTNDFCLSFLRVWFSSLDSSSINIS